MRVTRLWLTDFRCYESADIAPAPGVTLVRGDNGEGKTSLLEAIGWLATTRSFRGVPDAALVRQSAPHAVVRAEVERDGRAQLIEAEIVAAGRNRVLVNRNRLTRARDLLGTVRVSVFAPDDLALVKGGPAERREYLDDLLVALSPRYDAVRADYERVVRHRNALLRGGMRGPDDHSTLDVWDEQLVRAGAELARGRHKLLARLAGPLEKAYGELAQHSAPVSGTYEADWCADPSEDLAESLRAALAAQRPREIDRGNTLVGPHRDDWRLCIAGLDARQCASQGEQRSLALALRLAGHAVVSDVVGESPVLLLDDVFSELDPGRAEALVEHLPEGQALLTTAGVIPPGLRVDCTVVVGHGRVEVAA